MSLAESSHLPWHNYLFPLHISLDFRLRDSSLAEGGAGLLGLFDERLQLLGGVEQGVDHLLQVQPASLLGHFQPIHH